MRMVDVIIKKRNGLELSEEEINNVKCMDFVPYTLFFLNKNINLI